MRKKTIPKGHIEILPVEIVDRTTPEGKKLFDTLSIVSGEYMNDCPPLRRNDMEEQEKALALDQSNENHQDRAFDFGIKTVELLDLFNKAYADVKKISPANSAQKNRQQKIEAIKTMIIGYLEDLK